MKGTRGGCLSVFERLLELLPLVEVGMVESSRGRGAREGPG